MNDIKELVTRFKNIKDKDIKKWSESDVCTKFILPLMEALGWDQKDPNEIIEQRNTGDGYADFIFNINAKNVLVLEAKSFDKDLDGRYSNGKTFVEQAICYAWHLRIEWAILTNFREFRLYNVLAADDKLVFSISVHDMIKDVHKLKLLSKKSISDDKLESLAIKKTRKDVNQELYLNLYDIYQSLYNELITKINDNETVKHYVQILLNRFLVIRFAEDKNIIGKDVLLAEFNNVTNAKLQSKFIKRLRLIFRDFSDIYNTSLFSKSDVDNLEISNDVLESIIKILYKYNFDLIDSDILGSIYEDYLTRLQIEQSNDNNEQLIDVSEDRVRSDRKEKGIYYTPQYLVHHVLLKSLSRKLDACETPDDVKKIKIMDPACGSGSFLIRAFDIIKRWYDEYYEKAESREITSYRTEDANEQILEHNLFGVDFDLQAVEIASVNLMLKALSENKKLKSIKNHNIIWGNSLLDGSEGDLRMDKKKCLDWNKKFKSIMDGGGFDIVVGNPPYFKLKTHHLDLNSSRYCKTPERKLSNVAALFLNLGIKILKEGGTLGLVMPKILTYGPGWKSIRNEILKNTRIIDIVNCEEAFKGVKLEQVLITLDKLTPEDDSKYTIENIVNEAINESSSEVLQTDARDNELIYIESDPVSYEIRNIINKNSTTFGEIKNVTISSGHADLISFQKGNKTRKMTMSVLKGNDIARYCTYESEFMDPDIIKNHKKTSDKFKDYIEPHIVMQRIISATGDPTVIVPMAAYTENAFSHNTVTNIFLKDRSTNEMNFYIGLLNSRPIAFYMHKFIYCNAIRSMDLYAGYLSRLPVPDIKEADKTTISKNVARATKLASDSNLRIKPRLDDYLTMEENKNKMTLREYMERTPKPKKHKGCKHTGRVLKIKTNYHRSKLTVSCDYEDESKLIIKDVDIISMEVSRELAKFIEQDLKYSVSRKDDLLYNQVARARTAKYGNNYDSHVKNVEIMTGRFMKKMEAYEAWFEKLKQIDNDIDEIIMNNLGLNAIQKRHIYESTRNMDWANYR